MRTHRLFTTLLAVAVAVPTVATAQEEQRQRERQRQAEEAARQQVRLAQEALEAAIRALEESRTEETQEALFTVYAPTGIEAQTVHRHLESIQAYVQLVDPAAQTALLKVYTAS